jgi:uncharacterized protein (UPF0303 family)
MRNVVKLFEKSGYSIVFNNDSKDETFPITKTIYWDPSKAVRDNHGHTISPALALGHEMVHAIGGRLRDRLHAIRDSQYDNKEERRVIRQYENPAARQLGEGIRDSHHGTFYTVFSVDQR